MPTSRPTWPALWWGLVLMAAWVSAPEPTTFSRRVMTYVAQMDVLGTTLAAFIRWTPETQTPPVVCWVLGATFGFLTVGMAMALYYTWRAEDLRRSIGG